MKPLLLLIVSLLAGCVSVEVHEPTRTALVGSPDTGRGITVRLMQVDGVAVPWDYIQDYEALLDVSPGLHQVTLKVRTETYVCYPVFDLNVAENQVYRFEAKADGNRIDVSVDVREQGRWKLHVLSARVSAGPITVADMGP